MGDNKLKGVSEVMRPFSGDGDVVAWLKKAELVAKLKKMLFSFKNKYHYTYPNTYIALYHSHAKLPVTHTHTQKQEIVNHPS